jgi:hypothetical protein
MYSRGSLVIIVIVIVSITRFTTQKQAKEVGKRQAQHINTHSEDVCVEVGCHLATTLGNRATA